jgi:hydrogenase maturation protein HypF
MDGIRSGADPGPSVDHEARRFHVRGVVQGVGFRPFVHRLAERHDLAGWVRNESGEVFVQVEGRTRDLDSFCAALTQEIPPLARIDALDWEQIPAPRVCGFEVHASVATEAGRLPVSPDVAMCAPCRNELLDPENRRFGYPFITCTDCGPRYTVIETMPYDRVRTSMREFEQCPECLEEYRSPADRRFHSETNSCPACGPSVWLSDAEGNQLQQGNDAIAAAAVLLGTGGVLALRGLGGFHLAVDASDEEAVTRLRERKGRYEKPLAVMVDDLAAAQRLAHLGERESRLLTSRERPIVLARRRPLAALAASISPGLDTVGIMLAYTPLHTLLLREAGRPLVMTSGNVSELPIAMANEESRLSLGAIADGFLMHDRVIVSRYDDSVVRVIGDSPTFIRRARGFAPLPVELPVALPRPVLATGPHLKNTFALAVDRTVFVSQHIGDLENLETLQHFRSALARFRELFRIEPRVVVCDEHPGYLSTRVAEELALELGEESGPGSAGVPVIRVQHHHAHIAAVAAEHGRTGPVVGLAFDGTGYGADGHTWGAEVLVADLVRYRRAAHLRYAPMPGGDLAARRPWRAALGYRTLAPGSADAFEAAFGDVSRAELRLVEQQALRGVNSPLASSMGRLFDAASAVLGLRVDARYEGQAAMEFESVAWSVLVGPDKGPLASGEQIRARAAQIGVPELPFPDSRSADGLRVLEPGPLLVALGRAFLGGGHPALLAAAFHLAVADRAVCTASEVAEQEGLATVALGGGTFQNALLVPLIRDSLLERGFEVLIPHLLGPNDGAISYGQAAVAAGRTIQQGR